MRHVDEYVGLNKFEASTNILKSNLEFLREKGENSLSDSLSILVWDKKGNWNYFSE